MTEPRKPRTEGYGVIRASESGAHFYRRGNALCGKVTLYTGPLTGQANGTICSLCEAKLAKMKTAPTLTSGTTPKTRKTPAARKVSRKRG